MNVLIVGCGIVGINLSRELSALKPDLYDKYKPEFKNSKKSIVYDVCFICVDTPYVNDRKPCSLAAVYSALEENEAKIYILKSTVLPGTTEHLSKEFRKRIVFSPEYYGNTQHCNNYNFNFTILGGLKEDCVVVQQLLQHVYDASHTFHIVDYQTAELVKYMENAWLATKVSFCNQFYDISQKCNVDYETLRELFILDPRVNPSHTFVYRDKPYWDTHCLNKDVPAIANEYGAEFLKFIIKYNSKRKHKAPK